MRESRRFVGEVAVANHRTVGNQQARHFPLAREVGFDQRVKIGVHRVSWRLPDVACPFKALFHIDDQ